MSATAVMPTRAGREHFWHGAIRCFLGQTYDDAELLILDESPSPAPGEWPDRVRYVWMPDRRLTTGQKRNAVNELAESDVIVHWDDDDWSHPRRLADQMAHLFASGARVVGYHDLLYLKTPERTLWKYRFQGTGPYATGTSLCYRREWWEGHRFNDGKSVGEDTDFWIDAVAGGALASKDCEGLIVARAHAGNTYTPSFGQAPFLPADRSEFPDEFLRESGL